MNQDQLKEKLLAIQKDIPPFTLIFSGKKSKKVNGLYKPESREIIIHNRNFSKDSAMIYTGIHELAHHLHFHSDTPPNSTRSHTNSFWALFHHLLFQAEEKGIYQNPLDDNKELQTITREIKEKYLKGNADLMLEFGKLLFRAWEICKQEEIRFEDYADRHLGLHRSSARNIIQVSKSDLPPEIGYENMLTLAKVRDPQKREEARRGLEAGLSPDMVKQGLKTASMPKILPREKILSRKKEDLARKITRLQQELQKVEQELASLEAGEIDREKVVN